MEQRKYEHRMSHDTRLAVLETTILNINATLLDIRHDISDIRQDIKQLSNEMNSKFDVINNRLWSNFLWSISMMIGLAGLIAHTQHWI